MFFTQSLFVCAAAVSVFASAFAFAKGKYQLKMIPYSEVAWKDVQGTPVELAPGSYVMQPGKNDHNDKCKEGADCVILLISDKKADYIPAKIAKK
jgi:hypothetical protein